MVGSENQSVGTGRDLSLQRVAICPYNRSRSVRTIGRDLSVHQLFFKRINNIEYDIILYLEYEKTNSSRKLENEL